MRQFVVDSFACKPFSGSPVAVCFVDEWPSDELMLAITRENGLGATCFVKEPEDGIRPLRCFAPAGEAGPIGFAVLGAGALILTKFEPEAQIARFSSNAGEVSVMRTESGYDMDFPAFDIQKVDLCDEVEAVFGIRPLEVWKARDLVCVMDSEATVRALDPADDLLVKLDGHIIHATAQSDDPAYDIVSRSFAPKAGVHEEAVCGSGHCHIFPYWAERLGKENMVGLQASQRTGVLTAVVKGDGRCHLAGGVNLFSEGELNI